MKWLLEKLSLNFSSGPLVDIVFLKLPEVYKNWNTLRSWRRATIGGTAASTLLTLFVVPCAYSILTRFESRRSTKEHREALKDIGALEKSSGQAGGSVGDTESLTEKKRF